MARVEHISERATQMRESNPPEQRRRSNVVMVTAMATATVLVTAI